MPCTAKRLTVHDIPSSENTGNFSRAIWPKSRELGITAGSLSSKNSALPSVPERRML